MGTVKAVVQKVIPDGQHGPFAVATSEQLGGSVTFSLEPTVWQEDEWPEEGMMVFLGKLRQKRAGWRAKTARFWSPSDEQTQQTERRRQVEFLYPFVTQFPFDAVCRRIVLELEKRNWQVPGIEVDFNVYGSGVQKFRMVSQIKSKDFELWFCRIQRSIPCSQLQFERWNDIAAVTQINIPKKELHIYDDESEPSLNFYVGNNWKKDREQFMNGLKVNSKLNGEPRRYLKYKGACNCKSTRGASFEAVGFIMATMMGDAEKLAAMNHTHPGRRSPLLVHDNDLNREYDPVGDEPRFFHAAAVFEEFRQYLEEVVLKAILAHPVPEEKVDIFIEPAATPFPESIGPLFCFGGWKDEERIRKGKADPNNPDLPLDCRYGLIGSGYRLVPLGVSQDGTFPKIAFEGFLWVGLGKVTPDTKIDDLEVPGHSRSSDREKYIIRISPKSANDIYIADWMRYEKARNATFEGKSDDFRAGDADLAEWQRATARTLIPVAEYQGGFEQPVVLINRELGFDEVEVVSGPHENRYRR